MTTNSHTRPAAPAALVAFLLSSLCPGLGQLHCGRWLRGTTFLVGSLLLVPVVRALVALPVSTTALTLLLAATAAWVLCQLASMLDALLLAHRLDGQPVARPGTALTAILVAVGLAHPALGPVALRSSVLQAYVVPSATMAPSILPGDRVLALKTGRVPRRGDIVVFPRPDDRAQLLVKRVVGLPGDTVAVLDDVLLVGGEPVSQLPATDDDRPFAASDELSREVFGDVSYPVSVGPEARVPDLPTTTIPSGQCLVLGDRRSDSVDSRVFGLVALDTIEGIVNYVLLPADGLRRFGSLVAEPLSP